MTDTPENWDAASRGYADQVAPRLMEPFMAEFVDRLDVTNTSEALEVAAGSGALSHEIAKRAKSLLATDFSPRMVELLSARMEGAAHVTCEVMDGQALNVGDAAFDRVGCCFGLMFFPNRSQGFSEMRRILRPGGRALVTGWAAPDKFELFGVFLTALNLAFPDLPKAQPPPIFGLADLAQFKTEMEAAGFTDVTVDYVQRDLVVPDIHTFWSMLTDGAPPAQVLLERIGPMGAERLRSVLAEVVYERFGEGEILVSNSATVGCGNAPN
jgi:SAM-dependent methyltransferase